ncbi:MAG: oligosaccharide flippase family protein [Pseudomonadota bacterium]
MSPLATLKGIFADDGLKNRAIRSSGMTAIRFGGQNFMRLASNLILTRLLFPEAFGIMAIIQVVLSGAAMFSDLGIRSAIVQDKRGNDPAFLNTAWTIQIGRGFLLGLIVAVSAGPIADFYDTPILADLLLVSAFVPVIQGFVSTRMATASRELFLGRMVALHLGSQLIGILVMIAMAWWLETVWALVIGSIVGPLIITVLSHVNSVLPGIKNRILFEKDAFTRLLKFGKYIFLATVAGFFINQGDKAILGKYVTLSELAIYNIAFFLASVPMMLAQTMSQAVLFPLYARRPPSESAENRRKIDRARIMITGVLMCGLALMALIGDWLIRFLYDPRYYDAGPLMILIALAAMPRVIMASYSSLPLAAGDSGRYATVLSAGALFQLSLVFVGAVYFGVVGVILAPLISAVLYHPALAVTARRYNGWDLRHDLLYYGFGIAIALVVGLLHGELISDLIVSALARARE